MYKVIIETKTPTTTKTKLLTKPSLNLRLSSITSTTKTITVNTKKNTSLLAKYNYIFELEKNAREAIDI